MTEQEVDLRGSSDARPGESPAGPYEELIMIGGLLGVGLAVFGVGVYKSVESGSLLGPGVALVAFGALLTGAALPVCVKAVREVRMMRSRGDRVQGTAAKHLVMMRTPMLGALMMFAYIVMFRPMGYLVSTFALALAIMILFGWRGWRVILASVALPVLFYVVFRIGLQVPLPEGMIDLPW